MLIFGDETCINLTEVIALKLCEVYNLSNAIEKGTRVFNLVPPVYITDDKGFDVFYANYILSNDQAFVQFMSIMYSIYEGKNVYILIDHDEYRDLLTESLAKFIQQRYGYSANMVNEPSDMDQVTDGEFSIQGLYNLDIDKERYTILVTDITKLEAENEYDL